MNDIQNIIHAWKQTPHLHRIDQLIDHDSKLPSASYWTKSFMNSFRMLCVYDVDIDINPSDINSFDISPYELFWYMTRDDLYDKNWSSFYHYAHSKTINPNILAGVTACMYSIINLIDRRKSQESDLSSTSDEGDKSEFHTQSLAQTICESFLNMTQMHQKERPTWDYKDNAQYYIRVLGTIEGIARNDGAIVHINQHGVSLPFVWIETKPYEYIPRKKTNYENKIPQKCAEALSIAQYRYFINRNDQQVYGIEFSHRYVSFWSTFFPKQYLDHLYVDPQLDPENVVIMKRSRVLDLVESDDRKEFVRLFIGLLRHINNYNNILVS